MSFVIAAIMKDSIYVLGDTQLNDENGAVEETGIKVVPIGNNTLVGFTGTYHYFINMMQNLTEDIVNATFKDKILFVKEYIQTNDAKNNVVIVGIEDGVTKYAVLGRDYGYNISISSIENNIAEIKVLLPPEVTEYFCKQYIHSMICIKTQMCNCIKAVSTKSQSVNDKIMGFYMNKDSIQLITENIKYEDITYRLEVNR